MNTRDSAELRTRAPWRQPILTKFGSVAELTRGTGGTLCDNVQATVSRKGGPGEKPGCD